MVAVATAPCTKRDKREVPTTVVVVKCRVAMVNNTADMDRGLYEKTDTSFLSPKERDPQERSYHFDEKNVQWLGTLPHLSLLRLSGGDIFWTRSSFVL